MKADQFDRDTYVFVIRFWKYRLFGENILLNLHISGLDQVTYGFHPTGGDHLRGQEVPQENTLLNL